MRTVMCSLHSVAKAKVVLRNTISPKKPHTVTKYKKYQLNFETDKLPFALLRKSRKDRYHMKVRSNRQCEFPQLQMYEHKLTERELEYFKPDACELKHGHLAEGILGGVFLVLGIILAVCSVLFFGMEMIVGLFFSIFMITWGIAAIYNAATVRGNSWERFQRGEIKPAELVIPNAYFIKRELSSSSEMMGGLVDDRCWTGMWEGRKHTIHMYKRENNGFLKGTYDSFSDERDKEAESYVGKRCLAKVDYRRGKVYEIEVYLDEVYGEI